MKTKNHRIKTYIENQRYRIDVHRITALKDGATRWKEPKGPWNGDARKTMDGLHLVAPDIYIGDRISYHRPPQNAALTPPLPQKKVKGREEVPVLFLWAEYGGRGGGRVFGRPGLAF